MYDYLSYIFHPSISGSFFDSSNYREKIKNGFSVYNKGELFNFLSKSRFNALERELKLMVLEILNLISEDPFKLIRITSNFYLKFKISYLDNLYDIIVSEADSEIKSQLFSLYSRVSKTGIPPTHINVLKNPSDLHFEVNIFLISADTVIK